MVFSPNKNDIFAFLKCEWKPALFLITVNYRTYIKVRTISTILGLVFCMSISAQYRSIDGTGVHPENLGSTNAPLERRTDVGFADGISEIGGQDRPNPRIISNEMFAQDERIDNLLNLSDYVWAFGQFLDHDISLVGDSEVENAVIPVIAPENFYEVGDIIAMHRSEEAPGTGTDTANPRGYINLVTSFIDGSMVYGSDEERADWLRDHNSTIGELKTSDGDLLPWNTTTGEINAPKPAPNIYMPEMDNQGVYIDKHFVAGDVRANENPLLIALHTVFVREHNRLCREISIDNPGWSSDKIYQEARKKVGAYIQAIAYYEWLPSQGIEIAPYTGYTASVEPNVFNVFSAAAFRMGHTLINSSIIRMEDNGSEMTAGNVSLDDAYFNPTLINIAGGIEPYLKGMATNLQQDFDCKLIDDLRNNLFSPEPGVEFGLDLASININRGRERGLPDYNTVRFNFGLPLINDFSGITSDPESAQLLEDLYEDIDKIDPWVGMLAEDHEPNALVGKLVMTILEKQFQALRDGDVFYFENDPAFDADDIHQIKTTTLQDIIMRNTSITLMQDEVFEAMPHEEIPNGADLLPLHLEASVYPNPMDLNSTIKLYMELAEPVNISVYASSGNLISAKTMATTVGNNFIPLEMNAEMPRGLYNIKLETNRGFKILRVIKK